MTLNGESLALLKRIGLNHYESKVYSALISSESTTAGNIAARANVPRSRVYDVLLNLEKKGFIITHIGRPVKYSAILPEQITAQIKANYEKEYLSKIAEFEKIEPHLIKNLKQHTSKSSAERAEMVGVLRGRANLYGHMCRLIENASKRVSKFTNEEGLGHFEKYCISHLEKAKKRGIKIRVLANIENPLKVPENARNLHQKIGIRKTKGNDARFFIKDGNEAVMVLSKEDTGLWIKSPYMVSYLEKMFDKSWDEGKQISF